MHYQELDLIHRKSAEQQSEIDFLTSIIKANQLHEADCIAFSLPKDHSGSFGFAASMSDPYCHCWLDRDNRAEPGKAFAFYHVKDEKLGTNGYVNRYGAVKALLEHDPSVSGTKNAQNHWNKTYAILEVTINPTESEETTPNDD